MEWVIHLLRQHSELAIFLTIAAGFWIGKIKVGGLTKNEAENMICEKLMPYLKETPIVTVRLSNYKISVLGEVKQPGSFTVTNEKVNVLEAHNVAFLLNNQYGVLHF